MMKTNLRLILLFTVVTVLSHTASSAIFGADDRVAVTAGSSSYKLARSTAISVLSTLYSEAAPGVIKLEVDPPDEKLCKDERFSQDVSLAYSCTGFLVGPDLIATAGHCMVNSGESKNETGGYCEVYSWLFDYQTDADGKVNTDAIPAKNLYRCKKIIYAVQDDTAPFRDYALIQLDRPVTDRMPLKLSADMVVDVDAQVSMIGYPLGTPAKHSIGAKVLRADSSRQSFLTNLDAFEGNSGSPAFNAAGEVIGILISGAPSNSFVTDPVNSCQRYNRCDDEGQNCLLPDSASSIFPGFQGVGSDIQRILPVIKLIEGLSTPAGSN